MMKLFSNIQMEHIRVLSCTVQELRREIHELKEENESEHSSQGRVLESPRPMPRLKRDRSEEWDYHQERHEALKTGAHSHADAVEDHFRNSAACEALA